MTCPARPARPAHRAGGHPFRDRPARRARSARGCPGTAGGRAPGGQDGTILLLSLGFCVIAVMLVLAVTDASAVFLARRDLAAAVDGAALAAAQQVDVGRVYAGGAARGDLPLDAAQVRAVIAAYRDRTYPAADYPGLRLDGGTTPDRRQVLVRGTRPVRLALFGPLEVHAEARAATRASG